MTHEKAASQTMESRAISPFLTQRGAPCRSHCPLPTNMARTKQTARKSEVGKPSVLLDANPPPPEKRPREEDEGADLAMTSPKKARLDDVPTTTRLRFVIVEAGEEHDTMAMNVVEIDADGRDAFEAFMRESRDLDEKHQRSITSHFLRVLVDDDPYDYDDAGDELLSRWTEIISKYHASCTFSSSYMSYKQPWLRDVAGVFWICNWY